jgi:hypothetical protein
MLRVGNRAQRKGHGARLQNLGGCGQATGQKPPYLPFPIYNSGGFSIHGESVSTHARSPQSARTELDFKLENHGFLFLLPPLSSAAKEWMQPHSPEIHFWGDTIVIESRYVTEIVDGVICDGPVLR